MTGQVQFIFYFLQQEWPQKGETNQMPCLTPQHYSQAVPFRGRAKSYLHSIVNDATSGDDDLAICESPPSGQSTPRNRFKGHTKKLKVAETTTSADVVNREMLSYLADAKSSIKQTVTPSGHKATVKLWFDFALERALMIPVDLFDDYTIEHSKLLKHYSAKPKVIISGPSHRGPFHLR